MEMLFALFVKYTFMCVCIYRPLGDYNKILEKITFKLILVTDGCDISSEIALRWTSRDLSDDKSTLVQVMAWYRQASSHYLNQCWPRSLPPYGITWPQWVKFYMPSVLLTLVSWTFVTGGSRSRWDELPELNFRCIQWPNCIFILTHRGWDKLMALILQMPHSNAFCWLKIYQLLLKIHWNLFLVV